MADAGKLKQRILKTLKIVPLEEFESKNKDVKFALKYTPFQTGAYVVVIEYHPKIDMIRVVASIAIGKKLQDNFKGKKDAEKNEINEIFSKTLRARSFTRVTAKDFTVLEGYKLLFQQNFSAQMLFDAVTEAVFVIQDAVTLLVEADQSLKVPKVSEATKNMFQ